MKKRIIIGVIVFVLCLFCGCSRETPVEANEDDTVLVEDETAIEETEVRTWQDDAENELSTCITLWVFENGIGQVYEDGSKSRIGRTFENYYDYSIYYAANEFEGNEFLNEYIRLYNESAYETKTDLERDMYNIYAYTLINESKLKIENIIEMYSFGYNEDRSVNETEMGGNRGLFLYDGRMVYVPIISPYGDVRGLNSFDVDEFNEKFKTTLNQEDGIMNGIYLQISCIDDYKYRYENVDQLFQAKEFPLVAFFEEYASIYKKHRSDVVKVIENEDPQAPKIGMTESEVENSLWGTPKKINITETIYGSHEQWVYGDGRYVYIDNGKVTAIQH